MRIALIGNMNNNHFALMRYLRDRGYDAHLFMYAKELDHFLPENDTFELEKWQPYIHSTTFLSSGFRVLKNFLKIREARRIFKGFDYFIGNNFAPFITWLGGKRLNVFLPHALGGEYLGLTEIRGIGLKQRLKYLMYHNIQYRGLKYNTNYIGTIDKTEFNLMYYTKYGLINKVRPLAIPMVYIEDCAGSREKKETVKTSSKFANHFPVAFIHSRHDKDPFIQKLKGTDVSIRGFVQYVKQSGNKNALLVILEYGNGIDSSKKLIRELNIESQVMWIPQMPRQSILCLLEYVDIGLNAMGGYIWGGTGWEFIAKGVPFIHNLGRTAEEFEKETNLPCPDIFHAKNENDISKALLEITESPQILNRKSDNLKRWFLEFNKKNIDKVIYYLKKEAVH